MRALLAHTRRIKDSTPLQVQAITLLTLTATDQADTPFSLYISDRALKKNGHIYLPLLANAPKMQAKLPDFGGLAYQSKLTFALSQPIANPNKKLSDLLAAYTLKSVALGYILGSSTEEIVLFSGDIQDIATTDQTITITALSGGLVDTPPTPGPTLTLAEHPNLALADLDKASPLVFGSLNDADMAAAAPTVNLSQATQTHLATRRGKTYGDVYYLGNGALIQHPSVTKNADGTFVLKAVGSQTLSRNKVVQRGRWTFSDTASWTPLDIPAEDISSIRNVTVRFYWGNITTNLNDSITLRYELYHGTRRIATNSGGEIYDEHSSDYTTPPDTLRYSGTLTGQNGLQLRVFARTTRGGSLQGYESDIYGCYAYFKYTYVTQPPDIPRNAKYFQAITAGYEDGAANYPDGPAVNAEDAMLTYPIDILHALFRDKDYGAALKSATVDRSNIASLRSGRFDFSIIQALNRDRLSSLLHNANLYAQIDIGTWRFFNKDGPIRAVFSPFNTLKAEHKNDYSRVKNQFFIQYGYSAALNLYTKHLIRSPNLRGSGSGSLAANGTFTAQNALPSTPSLQDRMLYNGHYYLVTQGTSASSWKVKREDGTTLAAVTNKKFYIGVNFDHACHLSEQRYGLRPYQNQENRPYQIPHIQDDGAARSLTDQLVAFHSSSRTALSIVTTMSAVDLQAEDNIAHTDYTDKIGETTANIDWYATTIPYTLESGVAVSTGDILILQHPKKIYFEAVMAESGGTFSRGQLNSIPRRWPSQTGIYRATHKFFINNLSISRNQIAITAT